MNKSFSSCSFDRSRALTKAPACGRILLIRNSVLVITEISSSLILVWNLFCFFNKNKVTWCRNGKRNSLPHNNLLFSHCLHKESWEILIRWCFYHFCNRFPFVKFLRLDGHRPYTHRQGHTHSPHTTTLCLAQYLPWMFFVSIETVLKRISSPKRTSQNSKRRLPNCICLLLFSATLNESQKPGKGIG